MQGEGNLNIHWANKNLIEKNAETDERFEELVKEAIEKIEQADHQIGEGKTARVCLLPEQANVCLKILENKGISKNRTNDEMAFLDEAARIGIRVPKPVCSVETRPNDYLFMETINGFSLKDLVEEDLYDKLPEGFSFKDFFDELREQVKKMHNGRIYHRDLHLGNVMINQDGAPVIIDFGDATKNHISSEDPYREIDAKGELKIYGDDDHKVSESYREVGMYLKNKGHFDVQEGG